MDVEEDTRDCRTCGRTSANYKSITQNKTFKTWLDKTLNLNVSEDDGKSTCICVSCCDMIKKWALFRMSYNKAQERFTQMSKQQEGSSPSAGQAEKPKGPAARKQKRLDQWLNKKTADEVTIKQEVVDPEEEEVTQRKFAPIRVKVEPKLEADLYDTYGSATVNGFPVKDEVKEEPSDNEDDSEVTKIIRPTNVAKRLEAIRLKFLKIGEREKKAKLLKQQRLGLEKARELLPAKAPRKAPVQKKPRVQGPARKQRDPDSEKESTEKDEEPIPARVTRKKQVNYSYGSENEESDPDDPDEVDYDPKEDGENPKSAPGNANSDDESEAEQEKEKSDASEAEEDNANQEEASTEQAEEPEEVSAMEADDEVAVPNAEEPTPPPPAKPAPATASPVRKNKPMPKSKKRALEEQSEESETPPQEEPTPQPAKKRCLPASVQKKLEEAKKLQKQMAGDSGDDEEGAKKTNLLDYFSVMGKN